MADYPKPPKGWRRVFVRWVRHPKTGARIYPRSGKVISFLVRD